MRLSPIEIRWAQVVLRALVPAGALGGAASDAEVAAQFADECAQPPLYGGLLLRFSLWLAWWSPPFVLRRWRTLGGLDEAGRAQALERLLDSDVAPIRLAATYLKLTACLLALGDPRVLRRLNAYGLGEARRP